MFSSCEIHEKLFFDHGVQGLGSFLEVMHRIKAFAEVKGFREIITYGSSMGGYPALRAGLLLNATRAISMSGCYCWHVGRLVQKGKTTVRAFDPLCPCFSPPKTELVAVIPSRNERDVGAFEILQRTFPMCVAVKINAEAHTLSSFFLQSAAAAPVPCLLVRILERSCSLRTPYPCRTSRHSQRFSRVGAGGADFKSASQTVRCPKGGSGGTQAPCAGAEDDLCEHIVAADSAAAEAGEYGPALDPRQAVSGRPAHTAASDSMCSMSASERPK
jgi:hypothetical protein